MNQSQLNLIMTSINELQSKLYDMQNDLEHIRSLLRAPEATRELVTAKEAMAMLHVSRPTLRSYAKEGYIGQVTISPRHIMFDKKSIENYIRNGGLQRC